MQVMFDRRDFFERYFTERQIVAFVPKFKEENDKYIKLPPVLEPKLVVFPNGLLYALFARDPIETVGGQIFITSSSGNIRRPQKCTAYSHSKHFALPHGTFGAARKKIWKFHKKENLLCRGGVEGLRSLTFCLMQNFTDNSCV